MMIKIIFVVSIFFLSTLSHGPVPWILSLLLLFFLLLGCARKVSVNKSELSALLVLLSVVSFDAVIFVTDVLYGVQLPVYYNSLLNNYIVYIVCIFCFFILKLLSKVYIDKIENALAIVLKIHIALFSLQLLSFYIFGYFIDFVAPFTSELSRAGAYQDNLTGYYSLISFRGTGFYVEPSTYSTAVISLGWILANISSNNRKLINIAFLSAVFSFSTAGVIVALISLLVFNVNIKKISIAQWFLGLAAICIIGVTIYNNLEYQLEKLEATSGYRTKLVEETFSIINKEVIPSGFFSINTEIALKSHAELGEQRQLASLNDSSLFVFIALKFGYFGLIVFLLLFINPFVSSKSKISLFIMCLTKISITYPLFWMFLSISYKKK